MPTNSLCLLLLLLSRWKRLPSVAKVGVPAAALLVFVAAPLMIVFSADGWIFGVWIAAVALTCTTIPDRNHPVYA